MFSRNLSGRCIDCKVRGVLWTAQKEFPVSPIPADNAPTFAQIAAHYGEEHVTSTGHTIAQIRAEVAKVRGWILDIGNEDAVFVAAERARETKGQLGGLLTVRATAYAEMMQERRIRRALVRHAAAVIARGAPSAWFGRAVAALRTRGAGGYWTAAQ